MRLASISEETQQPKFHGQYKVTQHALERFRQRFPRKATRMKKYNDINGHLNELLKISVLHSRAGSCEIYDAKTKNTRLIIDSATQTIITVYPINELVMPNDDAFYNAIKATAAKELSRARQKYKKSLKENAIRQAEKHVELSEAFLKLSRTRAIRIKSAIQNQIAKLEAEISAIKAERLSLSTAFNCLEEDANRILGS